MPQNELEATFKIAVPGTSVDQLMDLMLGVAFDGKSSSEKLQLAFSISYNVGTPGSRNEVRLSREVEKVYCKDGVRRVRGTPRGRRLPYPESSAVPSIWQTIEFFRVTEQEPDIYEMSIMGGRSTPLGRRVRREFQEAFGIQ